MSNQWINEVEARAEERAEFTEWVDNNLAELVLEYVQELPTKEMQYREFERLTDMYNGTFSKDEEFEYWLEDRWADTDRRIGEE